MSGSVKTPHTQRLKQLLNYTTTCDGRVTIEKGVDGAAIAVVLPGNSVPKEDDPFSVIFNTSLEDSCFTFSYTH